MMKNYLLTAIIAIGMLASCSKGSGKDDPKPVGPDNEDTPMEMKFSVGTPQVSVNTKSTGSVGDLTGAENKWNGQELFIYGFDRTVDDYSTEGAIFIDNIAATAPASDASVNTLSWKTAGTHFFYEGNTVYDFYGYHIDDADATAGDAGGKAEPVKTADQISVKFKIDGSQDLMIAKAVLTAEQETALGANKDKAYSAYAARRNVHPSMTFEHLLSRLQFFIYPGAVNAGNVSVTGIEIKSQVSGELVVVHKTDANRGITGLNASELEVISLKERDADGQMVALTPVSPAAYTPDGSSGDIFTDQTATKVGESLLPVPAAEYELTVRMNETVGGEETPRESAYTTRIKAPAAGAFESGKSYKIKIVIYSLEEIVITTELKPWDDGGNVDVDPDKEMETPEP